MEARSVAAATGAAGTMSAWNPSCLLSLRTQNRFADSVAVNQSAISTQLATSLAAVNAALAGAPDLSTATPFALRPVAAAVAAEIAALESAIAEFDADIITTSVAGVLPGNPPPTTWPVLLNQVSDSAQEAALLNALGYLQRLATNLAQATGTAA
jgi:hypothetical protein